MVVADEEFDAGEAAELETGEELAPMDLGLADGDADAEDGALAVGADAHGDEDGAIDDMAAVADLFVAGVDMDIGGGARGRSRQRASPASSLAVQALTWEELTEVPQSSSTMAETLRVETPRTYISARA